MNERSTNQFFKYLETNNLQKINPSNFTLRELMVFARTHGYQVTIDGIKSKIEEIKNKDVSELSNLEKKWI